MEEKNELREKQPKEETEKIAPKADESAEKLKKKPLKKPKKEMDDEKFFSNKKNVIRLVLFLIALVIAIVAITYGVTQLATKEPGYYAIETEPDEALPFYDSGYTLTYHLTGSTAEIKMQNKAVTDAYTAILKSTYKLFDAQNVYEDSMSLGLVNQNMGKTVELSPRLFGYLKDAYEKTQKNLGYSLFAGPLNDIIKTLVYSSNAAQSDPINEPDEKEFIEELTALTFNPASFILDFDASNHTVRFDLSEEYAHFIDEYGIETPILDFGFLADAYRLSMITDDLSSKGFTDGYITTDSGVTLLLRDYADADYCFYSLDETSIVMSATVKGNGGSCGIFFRSFAMGDLSGFYTVNDSDKVVFRSKFMTSFDPGVVSSLLLKSKNSDLADALFAACALFSSGTETELRARAKEFSDFALLIDLDDGKNLIYYTKDDGVVMRTDYTSEKIS